MDTAETVDDSKQREHTMTEKGLELFHTTMDKHIQTLKRVSSKIDEHCVKITSGQMDNDTFLTHTKTAEATSELEEHTKFREDFVYKVEGLIRSSIAETTGFRPKSTLKEPSVKSQKKTSKKSLSKASLRSSNSSVLRQKAKISVETARKKLEFAQEESDLLTQKAEYEATCIIEKAKLAAKEKGLSARKEAAVAMAELNAIEEDETEPSQLDPSVPSFKPSNLPTTKETGQTIKHVKQEDVNNNVDFAKFLMKKDLLTSRFHKFDDCPENYVSWKNTFKCVVNEISATATEELDLLLQYTGVHSRKQVISIKVANAGYPSIALERAWNRLDSRYGSPEKVESALKMKLSVVPKITYKDKNKLYELSDVLAEIRAVKEKPEYSALLSFYDTAVGVNPTISKLPAGLQTMHVFKIGSQDGIKSKPEASASNYGEEKSSKEEVVTKCTEVCKGGVGKSCAKIVLLDILHVQKPNTRMRIYAIIDEQSNSTCAWRHT
ncbi:unnamed protein product [Mytilus coruscus]|uniref:Uncharacterized protein n=1 Tax=Mytilus coruscus TaxID=42192 RepID=A0A6J8CUM5_MYTCO|nr:unnamed protein product [Mytilus coruscus]